MSTDLINKQNLLLFFMIALLASLLLLPMLSNTAIYTSIDLLNHLSSIMQAKMALASGQFPLRIAPTDHAGWPYPLFAFYSTTSYTLAGFICWWLTPTNPYIAYKITIWCALVIGGLYMYRLVYWALPSRSIAFLASAVYLTSPYLIITIHHLQAFNETIALGVLPVVLYYSCQRYYYPKNLRVLLQTSVAWYLLATIHLLTFISTSIFVLLFFFLLTVKHPKNGLPFLDLIIAYAFGCMLALWHLGPIIAFAKYLLISTHNISNTLYQHTPSLHDLLGPLAVIKNQPHHSLLAMDAILRVHPTIGLPILLGTGIGLYLWARQSTLFIHGWLTSLLVLFFCAFFFIWSPFDFWPWLPSYASIIQYSWRLLGQLSWIGTLLFALALGWFLESRRLSSRWTALGLLVIVLSTCSWLLVPQTRYPHYADVLKQHISQDAYLIDAAAYPKFMSFIDTILIDATRFNPELDLSTLKPFIISPDQIRHAASPALVLQGNVPSAITQHPQELTVYINQKAINTYQLLPGHLQIDVPLLTAPPQHAPWTIQFKLRALTQHSDTHAFKIPLNDIRLQGFLNPAHVFTVKQTEKYCMQYKDITQCILPVVPSSIQLLELPVFYYPSLFDIRINGKLSPYFGILYENHLITGIVPQSNRVNHITVQFRGLLWANFVSTVAWGLWVLFFGFLLLKMLFSPSKPERAR